MFLTKRKNSQNWQLELRFPKNFNFGMWQYPYWGGRKHFTKSLGTPDRDKAELLAAPYIHRFRVHLYEWKHRPYDGMPPDWDDPDWQSKQRNVAPAYEGGHPPDLTADRLTLRTDMPLAWSEQNAGF